MIKNKLLLITVLLITSVFAQQGERKKTGTKEKDISISAGINLPIGNFSTSHLIGIAIDCAPTRHWFGITNQKKIAFTYNGGFAYYFGKKEMVSGYSYKYRGYTFLYGFGGVLYNPVKNAGISLTAGPAVGIYNGDFQFNLGTKLEASYYISTNIAIGPGITLMKESGADLLLAASLKGTWAFKNKKALVKGLRK